jgi:CRP-like cAMP-binding protein
MNETESPNKQDISNIQFRIEEILTPDELDRLNSSSNRMEYLKRDTIIKQGTRVTEVAILLSGLAKVTREMRKGNSLSEITFNLPMR